MLIEILLLNRRRAAAFVIAGITSTIQAGSTSPETKTATSSESRPSIPTP